MSKVETDHLLTTRGVTSEVGTGESVVGHVMLMDYDDQASTSRILEDTQNLPGLTAIFESSPGKYHVWNTTVRGVEGTALKMLGCKCDPMHISIGYRRRRWTLRVGPKDSVNARAESEEVRRESNPPKPLSWWVNETEFNQSDPHIGLLAAIFGRDGGEADRIVHRAESRCPNRVGRSSRIERYLTLVDEVK